MRLSAEDIQTKNKKNLFADMAKEVFCKGIGDIYGKRTGTRE